MDLFGAVPEKTGKGYVGGAGKNLDDIDTYVKPLLTNIGVIMKPLKHDNTSNKQVLTLNHKKMVVQIIIVENLHSIDTRANSNITEEVVNYTTEENRIKAQLDILKADDVYLFLYVKTGGWYILVRYDSIPEEHYQLTYRGRPDRKNRMWIPTEHLPKFKKVKHLEEDLTKILS